jgi:hypothetical protein
MAAQKIGDLEGASMLARPALKTYELTKIDVAAASMPGRHGEFRPK